MSFSDTELKEMFKHFQAMDTDKSGTLEANEVGDVLRAIGHDASPETIQKLIQEVDKNNNGKVDWDEFLEVAARTSADTGFGKVVKEHRKLVQVQGASGTHSFAEEEAAAFTEHINQCLRDDPDLDYLMPLNPDNMDLFHKVRDGVLLAKFINCVEPETIDERAINKKKEKISLFQINENLNLDIAAAASIGITTVNVGAGELREAEKHPHIILGLIWQLVKLQLLGSISLKDHPELMRLLEDGEELSDLLALPPEQLLLRWFNYHLKNSGSNKRVHNFSGDVKDSEAYTILLNQIAPDTCDKAALATNDPTDRASQVLQNAKKLNVSTFIQPNDIVKGNSRLNLAFTAAIFNQCPGLDPISQEELEKAGLMDDDFGDSREERAFRMWMNSLGIDGLYINNLFEDCKDGLYLLKCMDFVEPGIVPWKRVEMKPTNKFKKVNNTNLVVELGKQMGFSLVGIGGTDIVDGNKKLILALVWQLMRHHIIKFLSELSSKGQHVDDAHIIEWANKKVKGAGFSSTMNSFKDKSLRTGVFFIDLVRAVEPRIVNEEYITAGATEEDALLNAKYAISVARKLGAIVFVLPEDIVEVKAKMIMTFCASVMSCAQRQSN